MLYVSGLNSFSLFHIKFKALNRCLSVCVVQSELTKQQNGFKITLKTLEDNLLSRLSSASGDFLGDTELVENLETTKRTAADITEKVLLLPDLVQPEGPGPPGATEGPRVCPAPLLVKETMLQMFSCPSLSSKL